MRSLALALLAVLLTVPSHVAIAEPVQSYTWMPAQGEPSPEIGPDVPAALPVATVLVFEDEQWRNQGDFRFRTIDVPTGWTRVVLTYRQNPENDPWDRLFQVSIGPAAPDDPARSSASPVEGAEVLRGATPRSDMTVQKDVTRYASLLPQGGQAVVGAATSEWDQPEYYTGAQHVWVTLDFYHDATSALVEPPADAVVPAYLSRGLCKDSATESVVTFPAASGGTLEFFASNHGTEEGYKLSRGFDILVDGELLTTVIPTQYRYAWLGFYGGNDDIHPVVWWSAFRALDAAGVHTGVGEIPPYRLELNDAQMALLGGGDHTITVRATGVYGCVWITSLSFLMDNDESQVSPESSGSK